MPPPYALGPSFTCEPTYNVTVYERRWTSSYKGVRIVICEHESEVYANHSLEEALKGMKVKKMNYKGKDIFCSESDDIHVFSHQNLLFIMHGMGHGNVSKEIFLLIDWILYKLKIIPEEPEIPEEETPSADWLELIIHVPKDVYKVGEKFEGAYVEVINWNVSLVALSVLMFKIGNETISYDCTVDHLNTAYSSRMHIDPPSPIYSIESGFQKPGNFTIVYAYYDCAKIKEVLGIDCLKGERPSLEDLEKISPIKVVEKTVRVVE